MPDFNTDSERAMFRITLESLGIDLDSFGQQLMNAIDALKAQGFSDEEIISHLEADQKAQTGVFQTLNGQVEKQVDIALNRMFQLSSNEPLSQLHRLVKRVLDPAAEHCDTCVYLANLPPMPIEEIEMPGFQVTHGETNCSVYCKCSVDVAEEVPA